MHEALVPDSAIVGTPRNAPVGALSVEVRGLGNELSAQWAYTRCSKLKMLKSPGQSPGPLGWIRP